MMKSQRESVCVLERDRENCVARQLRGEDWVWKQCLYGARTSISYCAATIRRLTNPPDEAMPPSIFHPHSSFLLPPPAVIFRCPPTSRRDRRSPTRPLCSPAANPCMRSWRTGAFGLLLSRRANAASMRTNRLARCRRLFRPPNMISLLS